MMRQKRSLYTDFFNRINESAECKTCLTLVPWTTKSGTNCLRFHLLKHHPDIFRLIEQRKEAKLAKREEEKGGMVQIARNGEELADNSLPYYEHEGAYSPVEQKPTQEQLAQFTQSMIYQPETLPPTSGNPEMDILVMKMLVRDGLPFEMVGKRGFVDFCKHLSPDYVVPRKEFFVSTVLSGLSDQLLRDKANQLLTMDCLSLSVDEWQEGNNGLVSVKAHWIDTLDFRWKHVLIGMHHFNGIPSLEQKRDVITRALIQFKINVNQVKCLVGNEFGLCENVPYIECFSKKIDNCVKDVIQIGPLLEKIKSILKENFESQFEINNWKYMYSLTSFLLTNEKQVEMSPEELKTIRETFKILHIFASLVKVGDSQIATASIIIPAIKVIGHKLAVIADGGSNSDQERQWARELIVSFSEQTRGYEDNDLLKLCTFLDPSFQNSFFNEDFSPEVLQILRERTGEGELVEPKSQEMMSDFEIYLQNTGKLPRNLKPLDTYEKELKKYLDSERDCSTDPFEYWARHEDLPNLRTLAVQILNIPAETSKNSGSLFRHAYNCNVRGMENLIAFCKESLDDC